MAVITKETAMMIKAFVLLCNAALQPINCTPENAIDVIKAPDASNEVMCAMQAQAFVAETSLAQPNGKTYFKILCRRGEPSETIATQHWGRQRMPEITSSK
jgi:hypothetical protein